MFLFVALQTRNSFTRNLQLAQLTTRPTRNSQFTRNSFTRNSQPVTRNS